MPENHKQQLGHWGEQIAAHHLMEHGLTVIARNVRTPYGELDLLARDGEVLVVVEVKTRTSANFGLPEEAITPQKRAHLLQSAQHYLQQHPELDGDWRIDVVAIRRQPGSQSLEIIWFKDAISQ